MHADSLTTELAPLQLAVVGHTNVGKTSLLRTLLRDVRFGEVSPRSSTTRHVEGAALRSKDQILLVLHDTPGLEDGIALREYLNRLAEQPVSGATGVDGRLDGPACLARFLQTAEAHGRYEQEAKVLRQLLAVPAGLYVVDVREPVLPKYRDELAVLAMCGKPLLPVFNFVGHAGSHESAWRDALARLGLHAAVRFDTVAPAIDGEHRLYASLALLLDSARPQLERLQADLQLQARERRQTAAQLVAELLMDVAAARRTTNNDAAALGQARNVLQQAVREREQRCTQSLLALYSFRREDACSQGGPRFDGVWQDDLFHAETLKRFGVRLGGGVVAGAALGASVDVMLAGLSLGSATLVGALAAGALQSWRDYGKLAWNRLQGERVLCVDEAVVRLLALRQLSLLQVLERRGHAAQDVIALDGLVAMDTKDDGSATVHIGLAGMNAQANTERLAGPEPEAFNWRRMPLPSALKKAYAHPEWSQLNPVGQARALQDTARQTQLQSLLPTLLFMQASSSPA